MIQSQDIMPQFMHSRSTTATILTALLLGSVLVCSGATPLPSSSATYQEKAVAAVLMGEAWGQGRLGMTAVGEVIHERSVRLNKSPLQVVTAGYKGIHAFSCMNGTSADGLIRKFASKPEYKTALEIARVVCREPARLPKVTAGATHFTRSDETPKWARGKMPVATIGAHAFYRLRWI